MAPEKPAPAKSPASQADCFSLFVLSVFGCGHGPLVPGTYGSLAGLGIALLIPTGSWTVGIAIGVLVSSALTVLLGPGAIRATGRKDPQQVVMDEVAGMMLTLLLVPGPSPMEAGCGFLFFRAFDILKPPPARQLERMPAGWGILLDDLVAGLFAMGALWALGQVVPLR
jgi:phosphatidylglycerophosphatase A